MPGPGYRHVHCVCRNHAARTRLVPGGITTVSYPAPPPPGQSGPPGPGGPGQGTPPPYQPNPYGAGGNPYGPPPKKDNSTLWWILGIIGVVVIICCLGVCGFFGW